MDSSRPWCSRTPCDTEKRSPKRCSSAAFRVSFNRGAAAPCPSFVIVFPGFGSSGLQSGPARNPPRHHPGLADQRRRVDSRSRRNPALHRSIRSPRVNPSPQRARTGRGGSVTGCSISGISEQKELLHGPGHYLHRRSPSHCQASRAAHVLRLRGLRLLDGIHLPLQRNRFPEDQVPPARGGQHGKPLAGKHDDRRERDDAGGTGPHRAHRHAARRRRDPRSPRRREVRGAVHALHHEHLLDRGRGRAHQPPVLVPALRHEGQGLCRAAHQPRQGCQVLGAGHHA